MSSRAKRWIYVYVEILRLRALNDMLSRRNFHTNEISSSVVSLSQELVSHLCLVSPSDKHILNPKAL